MKTYDYQKAKKIIEENKDNLICASMGMHEDWFWTAEIVYENGEYIKELPENADELHEKFIAARKRGMSMFSKSLNKSGLHKTNPRYKKLSSYQLAGLYGSSWGTPVVYLKFQNGEEKFINCFKGESEEKQPANLLGCLSGPVQDNIQPISE